MYEKPSQRSEMSEVVWAQDILRRRIAPQGRAQQRIRNAAVKLGWGYSRTKNIWYADERVRMHGHELRRITELTGLIYEGRKERAELDRLIDRADLLVMGQDPDFYRAFADALRQMASAMDRPGTGGD